MEKLQTVVIQLLLVPLLVISLETSNPVFRKNCGLPTVPMRTNGQHNGGQRIVGGVEASPGSHPWIVSIQNSKYHSCGGALIRVAELDKTDIVITAAHCLYVLAMDELKPVKKMTVIAGAHSLSNDKKRRGRQSVGVKELYPHEGFNWTVAWHDIGIIKLSEPIQFNDIVMPLCLPSIDKPDIKDGDEVIAAGWGALEATRNSPTSDLLMQVFLTVSSHTDCKIKHARHRFKTIIGPMMFCTAITDNSKDTNKGDSGGPIVVKEGGVYVLRGVVSIGDSTSPGLPAVYTLVKAYLDWITKAVAKFTDVDKKRKASRLGSLPKRFKIM